MDTRDLPHNSQVQISAKTDAAPSSNFARNLGKNRQVTGTMTFDR